MRFADPWWLVLIPVVLIVVRLRARPGRRATVLYSSVGALRGLPRTLAGRLRPLVAGLEVAGLVLLALALARPQAGREDSVVSTEGVAIALVIDRSGSMEAPDLDPDPWDREQLTRLDVVKSVVADFIDEGGTMPGRPHDLIGLVTFAGYVTTHCPLTLDHAALLQLLDGVQLPRVNRNDPAANEILATAIGDALVIATDQLTAAPAKSKVVVLLSDGESNIGEASPRAAAEAARESGVRVYTVGVGTPRMGLDADTLKEVAEITGGRYFNARDADDLRRIYDEIGELERTEITTMQFTRWRERFLPFLFGGLGLLVLHRLLMDTRFRTLP